MIRREDAARCFGDLWDATDSSGELLLDAPYMSIAAELTPWCIQQFPAIAHFDGTARPQVRASYAKAILVQHLRQQLSHICTTFSNIYGYIGTCS